MARAPDGVELAVFEQVVARVHETGRRVHADRLIEHARQNLGKLGRSLRELARPTGAKATSGVVVSAGPSVRRRRSIDRLVECGYGGTVIAVDGSYTSCLKAGLVPDYVLTLDPHPTRIVRWFGDPDYEANTRHDDYFARQDLDVSLRQAGIDGNRRDIALVDAHASRTTLVIASSAPANVVARATQAGFPLYGWNPLVDDPRAPGSLTRALREINGLPCMNTGGTVGTAAWVFAASILGLPRIALVGFDYGYYADTPIEKTQTYYELVALLGDVEKARRCFLDICHPTSGEVYYTDPTYFWYRRNLLELLQQAPDGVRTVNCTEGGTIFGESIPCASLDAFLGR